MSTTQPIICCLGESVAGKPTQFVLEKALEARRMHWQVISVEMQTDRFSLVSEAALAMGFLGLRFYGDLEREAGIALTPEGSLQRFVGRATSALNNGNSWQVWDNCGPAWLSLLKQLEPNPSCELVWLQGDTQSVRSLFVALIAEPQVKPWLWLDAPDELAGLEHPTVRAAIDEGRISFSANRPPVESLRALWGCSSNDAAQKEAGQQGRIVVVSSAEAVPDVVAQCAESWAARLVVQSSLRIQSSVDELVSHRVSDADLAVAGEAYDFSRWTNCEADVALLRDAYDEYCDY